MAYGTNIITESAGLTVEFIRYTPSRPVILEIASASSRENVANIAILLVAKGTPANTSSLAENRGIVVKQGSTSANGASITWKGQLQMTPEDELIALFTGSAAGEHLEFTVKVRPV